MLAEDELMLAESSDLRTEGMTNYHVGAAAGKDVWEVLPVWTVEVGHIAVFRTDDVGEPWFLGEVVEAIDDGKARLGVAGECFRVHEMGNGIKRKDNSNSQHSKTVLCARASISDWKFSGAHWYHYTTIGKRGMMDVYLPKKTDLAKYTPRLSTHSRDAIAYWGPRDQVLKNGNRLLAKVLRKLDQNPKVLWSYPEDKPSTPQGSKRKRATSVSHTQSKKH